MKQLNIKSVTLINKNTKEYIYLSNWGNITTNLNTGKQFFQSRRLFNEVLKSCKNEYFVRINKELKTGEYINIHSGKIEKTFGIE